MLPLLIGLLGLISPDFTVAQANGLKIYISADMEGLVGAVTSDQLGPSGFEYQRFRQIMTNEVNAAIEAAREMGATEILISDSHGNGENLLIEQLPDDIQLIRSWPRPLMMMEGIDGGLIVKMRVRENFEEEMFGSFLSTIHYNLKKLSFTFSANIIFGE